MKMPEQQKIFILIATMVLGYLSWELPRIIIPGMEEVQIYLYGTIKTKIKLSGYVSILCQILSGMILGFWDSKRSLLWGAATMLPIFILATLDAALGFSPHSLYGIELVMYVIFTIPPMLGSLVGGLIHWSISRRETSTSKGA
jgi:hypothetical protein